MCDRTAPPSKSKQNGEAPVATVLLIPRTVNLHHNGPFDAGLFRPQAPRLRAGVCAGSAACELRSGGGVQLTWRP